MSFDTPQAIRISTRVRGKVQVLVNSVSVRDKGIFGKNLQQIVLEHLKFSHNTYNTFVLNIF